eukprot:jgi/Mesen1/9475/ME000063S08926
MARMVQCPKCRAILQEPPPGNPYYKCGSCFTVLQAKHATQVKPGLQGLPIDDSATFSSDNEGGLRLSSRKQEWDDSNNAADGWTNRHGEAEDSDASRDPRWQRTKSATAVPGRRMPMRSDSLDQEQVHMMFQRQNTMPSRQRVTESDDDDDDNDPGPVHRGSVIEIRSGGGGGGGKKQGGIVSKLLGMGPWHSDKNHNKESLSHSDAEYHAPVLFRRQKTLPAKLDTTQGLQGGGGGGGGGTRQLSEAEDQAGGPRTYHRQNTLRNQQRNVEEHFDDGGNRSDPDGLVSELPLSFGPGSSERADEPQDASFRRQRTMPPASSLRQDDDLESEEELSDNERVFRRQSTMPSRVGQQDAGGKKRLDAQVPARLRALLDKKPGAGGGAEAGNLGSSFNKLQLRSKQHPMMQSAGAAGAGGGAKAKQPDVVLPARLQELLDKKPDKKPSPKGGDSGLTPRMRGQFDKQLPPGAVQAGRGDLDLDVAQLHGGDPAAASRAQTWQPKHEFGHAASANATYGRSATAEDYVLHSDSEFANVRKLKPAMKKVRGGGSSMSDIDASDARNVFETSGYGERPTATYPGDGRLNGHAGHHRRSDSNFSDGSTSFYENNYDGEGEYREERGATADLGPALEARSGSGYEHSRSWDERSHDDSTSPTGPPDMGEEESAIDDEYGPGGLQKDNGGGGGGTSDGGSPHGNALYHQGLEDQLLPQQQELGPGGGGEFGSGGIDARHLQAGGPRKSYDSSLQAPNQELVGGPSSASKDDYPQISPTGPFSNNPSPPHSNSSTQSPGAVAPKHPPLPPPEAPQVVQCQSCQQVLAVPANLPPSKKGVQKLRCGKCLQVSSFSVYSASSPPPPPAAAAPAAPAVSRPHSESASRPMMDGAAGRGGSLDVNQSRFSMDSPGLRARSPPSSEEGSMYSRGGGGSGLAAFERGGQVASAQAPYGAGRAGPPGGNGGLDASGRGRGGAGRAPDRADLEEGSMDGSVSGGSQRNQQKAVKHLSPSTSMKETYARKVTVNGKAISDRLLERAEKRAGPIYPGDYWYDMGAGFWGVMGGPCMGIIPPLIKELSTRMPVDCAGGNTKVLVNGRELHQNDLRLLARRGLPSVAGRSYLVDISGHVTDETSGLAMRGLGKLAPSLEERHCGSGMYGFHRLPPYHALVNLFTLGH